MTDNVSHEERQAILDAMSKRRKNPTPDFGVRERKIVSQEEYQAKIIAEMRKDQRDAEFKRKERIENYMVSWKKQVGERFGSAVTDNPIILNKIERVKKGQGKHRTSILLAGDLGIGKTYAAYAYLNALIREGLYNPAEIVHNTESSILGRIASGGFKRDEMFVELTNPMHKVFFIDDVGQAYYSDETKRHSVWFELINHIYTNDLILVMTTNKKFAVDSGGRFINTDSLKNWVGDAAFDRIRNIVGGDGLIIPGNINRRPQVLQERDKKHS